MSYMAVRKISVFWDEAVQTGDSYFGAVQARHDSSWTTLQMAAVISAETWVPTCQPIFNTLNAELNAIRHLLALVGATIFSMLAGYGLRRVSEDGKSSQYTALHNT